MGQIVKFPGGEESKGVRAAPFAIPVSRRRLKAGAIAIGALRGVLGAMRLPVFLVLYWLRFPVAVVCKFVGGGGLLAAIIAYFVSPMPKLLWGFSLISFAAFVFMWAYDLMLMHLSPQEMVQSL